MPPTSDEPLYAYVYRRLANQIDRKGNVNPAAFTLDPGEAGLSVFRADIATPYNVLQARIESAKEKLALAKNEDEIAFLARWLEKNSNVETLLQKGYRIIRLPIDDLKQMGFTLTDPETTGYNAGHLEIQENPNKDATFENRTQDIIDLLDTGAARILSVEECLAQ